MVLVAINLLINIVQIALAGHLAVDIVLVTYSVVDVTVVKSQQGNIVTDVEIHAGVTEPITE